MSDANFFAELKRRNVYRVAVTYAVVSWLLIQAASILFPTFEAPGWVMKAFVVLLGLGFILAVFISWAFEATPEGLKRTEDIPPEVAAKLPTWSRRKYAMFIAVAACISLGLLTFQFFRSKTGNPGSGDLPAKSIAVLPFDNLSRDPDNAFFAEGVQDEILTRLAKVADLKVISRTSTQRFKSAPDNLPQIAKQLGVMHILEGSVQKANDQVRVNVQLINAMNDAHLWAEIYDRKLTDIFAVESEIAKTIADQLQAKLTGSEKQMMAVLPTTDTTAYELYHKGRSLWEHRSAENLRKAIAFYEQAIARDPNYALAYAGLASAFVILPFWEGADLSEANTKAKEAAHKALALDPNLAEGHLALGKVTFFADIDLAGAAREYKRAVELKPNDAAAHHWYGNDALAALGRFEEAIAEGKRAVELDPLSPVINADLGNTYYYARQYSEAMRQARHAIELDPSSFYGHFTLGQILQAAGDLPGAIAEYERARQLNSKDELMLTLTAQARAKAGEREGALKLLADLDRKNQHGFLSYHRALLYLSLDNKDEAMRCLEQSFSERDGSSMSWIKVEPMFDPLRNDPRFEALVQKVVNPK